MRRLSSPLKFSMTEILTLLLVGGVGFAAMRMGGIMASAALVVATLLFMATAVVAIVGEGAFRVGAIGFVVAGGIYGGLVFYFGESEFYSETGKLPTTQALTPVRDAITTYTFTNVATGETMTPDEARAPEAAAAPSAPPLNLSLRVAPEREKFMSVAHVLIGMALGYAGAKFAVAIGHRQRSGEGPSTSTET